MTDELLCLERGGRIECKGPVEYRLLPDNARSFPRCEAHFERRLADSPRIMEMTSPVPARWFDEANAGERWNEVE